MWGADLLHMSNPPPIDLDLDIDFAAALDLFDLDQSRHAHTGKKASGTAVSTAVSGVEAPAARRGRGRQSPTGRRVRSWDDGCEEVAQFAATMGRPPRAGERADDGYDLGLWTQVASGTYREPVSEMATKVRANRAGHTLKQIAAAEAYIVRYADRRARLVAIPGWVWAQVRAEGLDWVALLEAYMSERGRPPTKDETYRGYGLGAWVKRLRATYRDWENARHVCTPDIHPVPAGYCCTAGLRLGSALSQAHRLIETISPALIARIAAMPGWTWTPRTVRAFEESAALAADWISAHGRMPSKTATVDGYAVGRWVHKRRSLHAQGNLPAAQVAALEAIPGWVW